MLSNLHASAPDAWRITCLRHFNPDGAHPSGRNGENPLGISNNLIPCASQLAVGRRAQVQVFGGECPTPDGTGVRSAINVWISPKGTVPPRDWLQLMHRSHGVIHSQILVIFGYNFYETTTFFNKDDKVFNDI